MTDEILRIESLASDPWIAPGLTALCYRAAGPRRVRVVVRNCLGFARVYSFSSEGAAVAHFERRIADEKDPEAAYYGRWAHVGREAADAFLAEIDEQVRAGLAERGIDVEAGPRNYWLAALAVVDARNRNPVDEMAGDELGVG